MKTDGSVRGERGERVSEETEKRVKRGDMHPQSAENRGFLIWAALKEHHLLGRAE
jgi:hypothetical protein